MSPFSKHVSFSWLSATDWLIYWGTNWLTNWLIDFLSYKLIDTHWLQVKAKLTSGDAENKSLSKTSYSLTIMLITTCIVFACLTMPWAIMYENSSSNVSALGYAFIVLAMYTNHTINIFFYMASNKRFRVEVLRVVTGKASQVQPGQDSTATQSMTTNK